MQNIIHCRDKGQLQEVLARSLGCLDTSLPTEVTDLLRAVVQGRVFQSIFAFANEKSADVNGCTPFAKSLWLRNLTLPGRWASPGERSDRGTMPSTDSPQRKRGRPKGSKNKRNLVSSPPYTSSSRSGPLPSSKYHQDRRPRRSDPSFDTSPRTPRAAAQAAALALFSSPSSSHKPKSHSDGAKAGRRQGNVSRGASAVGPPSRGATPAKRPGPGRPPKLAGTGGKPGYGGRGRPPNRESGKATTEGETSSSSHKRPKLSERGHKPDGGRGGRDDVPQRRELPARPGRPATSSSSLSAGSRRSRSSEPGQDRDRSRGKGRGGREKREADRESTATSSSRRGGVDRRGAGGGGEGRTQPHRGAKEASTASESVKKRPRGSMGAQESPTSVSSPYPKRVRSEPDVFQAGPASQSVNQWLIPASGGSSTGKKRGGESG
ncbi:unnamed protein product, partial [Discosporangium mesarthrocarpum]